ncbi:MAG: polymerase, sigma-24 subunit, subfamily [Thermoleophilia bacterium]|nr:polymerase, sigma-24 subunit, subfamily [Thermoleophilia bacterium]
MDPSPPTDFQRVLEAARRGEDGAWRALYLAHAPAVLGYLRAQRAVSPEDLVGEVWLQAVRDLHRFTGDEGGFRGWLMTIAHHRLLDARRAATRRPVEVAEEAGYTAASSEPEAVEQVGAEQDLHRLLDGMPERQRTVLYLRYVQDMSQREVATLLGVSTPAMKMLQARALRALDRRVRELDAADAQASADAGVGALPFDPEGRSRH